MGDVKNSHQFDSSRINDDNKEEFAFKTDTATTTLIRRGINLIRTIEKLITHLIITSY